MLVKLKRDWFAPGGVHHRKGTIEYNGPEEELPSDATIVSENGRLPVRSNTPKPGHGAKPLEEQVLDLIPGAAPTHMIEPAGNAQPAPLSEDERQAREAESAKVREAEAKDKAKADTADAKAEVKETEAGVKNAEKAAEVVEKATDPLDAILSPKKK